MELVEGNNDLVIILGTEAPPPPPPPPPPGEETLSGVAYSYYSYGGIKYLGGAEVTLNGHTEYSSGTYPTFRFSNLAPGHYTWECSRIGYQTRTGEIEILEGVDNQLAIYMTKI